MNSVSTILPQLLNPFPGLRPFQLNESGFFFGRENQVTALIEKLSTHHFVAVLGNSGSGKSSLVRAGLLPEILKGRLTRDNKNWFIAVMHPGNTPVHNLAEAISSGHILGEEENEKKKYTVENILPYLKKDSLGLVQVVRELLPPGKNLIILIDQFEELFRFKSGTDDSADESTAFVNLLLGAIRQRDVPIYVVITIRSDFLGDCARFENLPEAINDGH